MKPRPATVVLTLLLVGCLPEITLPRCQTDQECLAVGDGFCRCSIYKGEGICLRSACPALPEPEPDVGDAVPDDDSSDDAEPEARPDPCPADAPAFEGDDCCPSGLVERHSDADCAVVSEASAIGALALPAALNAAGDLLVVHAPPSGQARVTRFDAELQAQHAPVELGVALDEVHAPVALSDGRFLVAGPWGLKSFAPDGDAESLNGAVPASTPIPMLDGRLLVVATDGRVLVVSGAGLETRGTLEIVADRAGVALAADEHRLTIVSSGALHGFDLKTDTPLPANTDVEWTGAPALGPDAVYAVHGPSGIGGLTRSGGQWQPLVPTDATGLKPLSPVVGEDAVTYVASGQEKQVTAIRWVTSAPSVVWTVDGLAAVPAGPPTLATDATILVPLTSGRLVALSTENGEEVWHYEGPGKTAGDALLFHGGGPLLMSGGYLTHLHGMPASVTAPWPRQRRDAAATAHAGL